MKSITEDGEIIDTVTNEIIAMPPPFFKTPWNHDTKAESDAGALTCLDKSKTQQQFAKDADINVILAKFLQTGELSLSGQATYADYEKAFDLQEQIVTAAEVEKAWLELPAKVRNILRDPKTFVDYLSQVTSEDLEDLHELGLVDRPPETPAPVTPPATSPAPTAPQPETKTP